MKNLNKAILIALGMTLPLSVMASSQDDVTIRMMEANERATEAVTSQIELPEAADDRAREHAARGIDTANENRGGEHGAPERPEVEAPEVDVPEAPEVPDAPVIDIPEAPVVEVPEAPVVELP